MVTKLVSLSPRGIYLHIQSVVELSVLPLFYFFVCIDTGCKQKSDHRRRKRVPAHIISFDEDGLAEQHLGSQVVSHSAPPTCLNSPASGMVNVPISAETVGAFISKTDVTSSEKQTQNVSTFIFIMISESHAIGYVTC
jgi:hypothetical protein